MHDIWARSVEHGQSSESLNLCKRGRWRLASSEDLRRSVLSLHHVLVRHAESSEVAPLSLLDWRIDPATVGRTRIEALRRAQEILDLLSKAPERFSDLARNSDDRQVASASGYLGVFSARELLVWPEILDCLAETAVGLPTPIVETSAGFHIFMRDAAIPSERFEASRIVIGHKQASFLKYTHRHIAAPNYDEQRTLSEALALAGEIRGRATADNFAALVREFSEHRDAARGGDLGQWTLPQATHFARTARIITELKIGEVSEPFDSELGVQIVLRMPVHDREILAARIFRRPVELGRHEDALAFRAVEHALTAENSSTWPLEEWLDGSEDPELEAAVKMLAIGGVSARPIRIGLEVLALARTLPVGKGVTYQAALPNPLRPNAARFMGSQHPRTVSQVLERVRESFDEQTKHHLASIHQPFLTLLASGTLDCATKENEWRRVDTAVRDFREEVAHRHSRLIDGAIESILLNEGG